MKKSLFNILILFTVLIYANAQSVLVEAESFTNKGGWVVDQQFVEQMGSPYLLAHGMGIPVADASTQISIQKAGKYHIWARTKNWAPGNWEAPGRFYLSVDGKQLENQLGKNTGWNWEYAGEMKLRKGETTLSLQDLTGFEGRCDALFLSKNKNDKLPTEFAELKAWRATKSDIQNSHLQQEKFDLVVVGGGIAGCAAAIAAAEQGLKVALVHDRPVLGGNASSEIRVHTLGIHGKFERILKLIDTEHYPNGSAEAYNDQKKRTENMAKFQNIIQFLNYRAFAANATSSKINYVDAQHTSNGKIIRFEAPLFVDCTGDGWIGYWAGAECNYGREAASKYNENWDVHGLLWSPETADNFVMGSSVLWNSENAGKKVDFPKVPWAMPVANNYAEKNGEWQWEFTKNELSQLDDAETIRDHLFRAIYGSFYNFKYPNETTQIMVRGKLKPINLDKTQDRDSLRLKWVSYQLGKRESRRLVGDYIYTFNDVRNTTQFEDAVVFEKRAVDVHYQENLLHSAMPDFLSEAMFYNTKKYSIPYRSLYSKNISNLFMAGRNFSCTHIGLGGPRVMNTTGQMGAAVGLAAAICKKHQVNPREIYTTYLNEYLNLIEAQK
ncbi:MAG: hypothetical protein AUK44_02705 [Porphyromonadaceae bacterium CG2_30_38_12]|nr:MAG: hypothetical protein AUK44_02705 [Porphyromonadaceae bacterium CG2_30_38_12]